MIPRTGFVGDRQAGRLLSEKMTSQERPGRRDTSDGTSRFR